MGIQIKRLAGLILLIFWLNTALGQRTGDGIATRLSLGRLLPEQPVEQVVTFNNPTGKVLAVENVQFTPPLLVRKITPAIEPGGQGQFTLVLDETHIFGKFEGIVRINFENNVIEPVVYHVEGDVVPPIEFKPGPAFHVATHRGKDKQASIEIINHRDQPLRLTGVDDESDRYTATLHTLDPGKHYRLDLSMSGQGKAGRESEWIRLLTADAEPPFLKVMVNTLLREKVYTFPESVELGALPLDVASNKDAVSRLAQTLMIYKPGTNNFEITPATDLDTIRYTYERGPDGDRFQFTVYLVPDRLEVGPIQGSITIKTNDQEFPVIKVPVHGEILPQRSP